MRAVVLHGGRQLTRTLMKATITQRLLMGRILLGAVVVVAPAAYTYEGLELLTISQRLVHGPVPFGNGGGRWRFQRTPMRAVACSWAGPLNGGERWRSQVSLLRTPMWATNQLIQFANL